MSEVPLYFSLLNQRCVSLPPWSPFSLSPSLSLHLRPRGSGAPQPLGGRERERGREGERERERAEEREREREQPARVAYALYLKQSRSNLPFLSQQFYKTETPRPYQNSE